MSRILSTTVLMTILYIFDIVLARAFSKLLDLIIVKTHKYKILVAKCTTKHATTHAFSSILKI